MLSAHSRQASRARHWADLRSFLFSTLTTSSETICIILVPFNASLHPNVAFQSALGHLPPERLSSRLLTLCLHGRGRRQSLRTARPALRLCHDAAKRQLLCLPQGGCESSCYVCTPSHRAVRSAFYLETCCCVAVESGTSCARAPVRARPVACVFPSASLQ